MADENRSRSSGQTAMAAPEHRAFEAMFADHAPHIWRALRSLGVREADIEDVCQEVFMIVHRKLSTFEGRSSLRTWIYGIALRVVADYRKKAHRVRERLVERVPDRATLAPQEGSVAQRQACEKLDRLLDSLSDEQRRVFVLFELEQLSMREIASLLECPLQTAYSRLEAAREVVQRGMSLWRGEESAR